MRRGQSTRLSTNIEGQATGSSQRTTHSIIAPAGLQQNPYTTYKFMLPISSPIRHCLYHTSIGVVSNTSKLVQILTQM